MNLFIDERMTNIDDLFNKLKSKEGINYIRVCESPVISTSIYFTSVSPDIKEIIREHLTDIGYYSYFEIWKNI
jgi:hypothetical protein